jgi:hypothetical protein
MTGFCRQKSPSGFAGIPIRLPPLPLSRDICLHGRTTDTVKRHRGCRDKFLAMAVRSIPLEIPPAAAAASPLESLLRNDKGG